MKNEFPMRINKYLAHKNYATRRGADNLIANGKILINNKVAKLGDQVNETDVVTLKGVEKKEFAYYAYYKPTGVSTIGGNTDEKSIKDVAKFTEKVFPLGRLDKDSEGLLIMTNDGRLTDKLLNPNFDHEKEYLVTVDKEVSHALLVKMNLGIKLGDYKTKKAKIRRVNKHSFEIILTEGKNRQIRRMCGSLGFAVKSLKRFRVMNIELGKLKPNQWRKITDKELKALFKNLGF
jgi:23S rRNA pseudouridine2604 synthase